MPMHICCQKMSRRLPLRRFFLALDTLSFSLLEEAACFPTVNLRNLKVVIDSGSLTVRPVANCHLYRDFVFGSNDICKLATIIHASYGPPAQGPIWVRLHVQVFSTVSATSMSEPAPGLIDLADVHLTIKALDIVTSNLEPVDTATWRAICRDSLRMIYPSLLQHPSNSNNRPVIDVGSIKIENVIILVNEVSLSWLQSFTLAKTIARLT